jgi:hypothetical protein
MFVVSDVMNKIQTYLNYSFFSLIGILNGILLATEENICT